MLDTLFKEFYFEDRKENMVLQFWLAVEEFRSILGSVWLRIRANSIFNEYLGEKQLLVRGNTFLSSIAA